MFQVPLFRGLKQFCKIAQKRLQEWRDEKILKPEHECSKATYSAFKQFHILVIMKEIILTDFEGEKQEADLRFT